MRMNNHKENKEYANVAMEMSIIVKIPNVKLWVIALNVCNEETSQI